VRAAGDPLAGTRLAVLGVADNGRRPAELTEVAVVHLDDGTVVRGPLTWRVRPNDTPTRQAVKDFGLRRADLLAAPEWSQIAEHVSEVLTGRTLVTLDLSGGYRLLRGYLPDWQPPAVVDLARLARVVWRGPTVDDDLPTLAEIAGLNPPNTTQPCGAARTAHTCAELLLVLIHADASRDLPRRFAAGEFGVPAPWQPQVARRVGRLR
jgi:DNA polymerase III epsilon subunit-like protein